MNSRCFPWFLALALGTTLPAAAPSLDEAVQRAALDYAHRTDTAAKELAAARDRIAREEQPLANHIHQLQDRVVALEAELAQLETSQGQAGETLQRTQRELDGTKRNLAYVAGQCEESLKYLSDSFAPGEGRLYADELKALLARAEDPSHPLDATAALPALNLAVTHVQRAVGGYAAPGQALVGKDNLVVPGHFVFLGPESFFQSEDGHTSGLVPAHSDPAGIPHVMLAPEWSAIGAAALFTGESGTFPADASGGKAVRLQETRGTFFKHVNTGGPVAYLILCVGAVSLVITLGKIRDARNLRLATAAETTRFYQALSAGRTAEARALGEKLPATTRELFTTGFLHLDQPAEALEEHLSAHLQDIRLLAERRLPLLSVIATASPLLGLLGTVMGMVRTFSLITVFGTGNAAKLSSGISEVLVTTELGLAVAIPALVAHGFLAHRLHKQLAALEKQAVEFVAAAGEAAARKPAAAVS